MTFKDMIQNAVNIGSETKFMVQVDSEEIQELSYIQLGTYLVSNQVSIERVHIILKEDWLNWNMKPIKN